MNYYPFHIGDFRSGTVNMSRLSRWIYRDMLDVYYDSERPLSLDLDELCDEIGVEEDGERKIVERLLRFKFTKGEDGYRHEICDKVIAEYHSKAETARTNGKLGGRPKKAKGNPEEPSGFQSGSNRDATGGAQETGSQANQEPITKNHKPVTRQRRKSASPSGDAEFFPGIDPQLVADFREIRKAKGAPITKTAIDTIADEAAKAGLTLEGAIRVCIARNWQGFKAKWLENDGERRAVPRTGANGPVDMQAQNRAALADMLRREEEDANK